MSRFGSKYAGKRSAAFSRTRKSRSAKARNTLRRFMRRVGPTRGGSMGFLTGKITGRRLRYGRNRFRGGIDQGSCSLKRQTYSTVLYNSGVNDDICVWSSGDPLIPNSNVPANWNLWNPSSLTYVSAGSSVSCPTEIGSFTAGGAGSIVRGRIRVAHNDATLSSDLNNWEYVKLRFVTIAITYMRTEYTAGNDASGISPTLEYFVDIDGTFISGTLTPEQDSVTELNRRPNMQRIKLTPNVTQYIRIKPMAFKVICPDPAGSYSLGGMVPIGYIDPNSAGQMAQPYSNMQFQVRNMQLPNSVEGQTSMIKIQGTYHYTCKRFIGQNVN